MTDLSRLCPCVVDDEQRQECPVHGDGETFVRLVQYLASVERLARRARVRAPLGSMASTPFRDLWDTLDEGPRYAPRSPIWWR